MSYRVTIDGHSWLTDELTLDEACAIEEELGMSWHTMEPINSARHAKAIISRLMAHREGVTLDLARARLGEMTVQQVLACMTVDKKPGESAGQAAPKAEGTPSGDTSSPSPSEPSPTT